MLMKVEAVLDERKIEDKRLDLEEILLKFRKTLKKLILKRIISRLLSNRQNVKSGIKSLADKFRDLQISGIKDIGKDIRKDEREWIMHH